MTRQAHPTVLSKTTLKIVELAVILWFEVHKFFVPMIFPGVC